VVGHDSRCNDTEELLGTHPLARSGRLRHVRLPRASAPPGRNRNAALRLARAPVVAFTDDDCRPPPGWLERALGAARRHPGSVVQGATKPDPDEAVMHRAPLRYSQTITPPSREAQACNIVYPRDLLERLEGFDERLLTGEDTELAARAEALGTRRVGAPEVVTYHAVVAAPVPRRLVAAWRWRDIPALVKRHPSLRRRYPLGIFWSGTHAWFALAGLGVVLARRRSPGAAALALPWAAVSLPPYGPSVRGWLRGISELPLVAALHGAEMGALAAGSLRHRTLLL
jgi:GT2 family glycosyltransferase